MLTLPSKYSSYRSSTSRDFDNYFAQVEANYSSFTNSFQYYKELIHALQSVKNLDLMPLYEFKSPLQPGFRRVSLRHDIDADPQTAVRAARFLASRGVCGSFYLLHHSPYYGEFHEGVFIRNPELSKWVLSLIVSGCELGIHNDAYGIYAACGVDGAQALRGEIEWLRKQGAIVRGTVAHNSAPTYGAENFEIFSEKILWKRRVIYEGKVPLPLGALSMMSLALKYEGTFAVPHPHLDKKQAIEFCADRFSANIRAESWMKRYLTDNPCCRWSTDFQFWLTGKDEWCAADTREGGSLFEFKIGLNRLLEIVRELPPGSRSVMVIHPEYVRGDKI